MWEDDDESIDDADRLARRVDEMLPVLLQPMRDEATGRRLERLQRAEADLRR
jgi:hypothetical protein